jgi:hypothetical protein
MNVLEIISGKTDEYKKYRQKLIARFAIVFIFIAINVALAVFVFPPSFLKGIVEFVAYIYVISTIISCIIMALGEFIQNRAAKINQNKCEKEEAEKNESRAPGGQQTGSSLPPDFSDDRGNSFISTIIHSYWKDVERKHSNIEYPDVNWGDGRRSHYKGRNWTISANVYHRLCLRHATLREMEGLEKYYEAYSAYPDIFRLKRSLEADSSRPVMDKDVHNYAESGNSNLSAICRDLGKNTTASATPEDLDAVAFLAELTSLAIDVRRDADEARKTAHDYLAAASADLEFQKMTGQASLAIKKCEIVWQKFSSWPRASSNLADDVSKVINNIKLSINTIDNSNKKEARKTSIDAMDAIDQAIGAMLNFTANAIKLKENKENVSLSKMRGYRLATTDLFVEKAIAYLEEDYNKYMVKGSGMYKVAFLPLILGIVVSFSFYGKPIIDMLRGRVDTCEAAPCSVSEAVKKPEYIINRVEDRSTQNCGKSPCDATEKQIFSGVLKTKDKTFELNLESTQNGQSNAEWMKYLANFVIGFTFYGLLVLLSVGSWRYGKAMMDQAERLREKRHALRQGRLFVHLKDGELSIDELEKAFTWNMSNGNAFGSIPTEASAPWGSLFKDALTYLAGILPRAKPVGGGASKL